MKCVPRIMIIILILTVNQNQKEPTQGHQIIKTFNQGSRLIEYKISYLK